MHDLYLLASAQKTIGYVIAVVLLLAFVVAIAVNVRKGRAEVGSEVELAPNRKPYMDDEELETKKLDRTLGLGLVALGVIALTLPLYWLAEPGRQSDMVKHYEDVAIARGEEIYVNGAQCAGCHGPNAVGGVASYTILDPKTGEYVDQVQWKAPALNTVMYRYSEDEVRFILNYGRPFSPMSAWGTVGGGPMNDQSIQTLIDYLKSIQIPQENCTESGTRSYYNPTCLDGKLPAATNKDIMAEAQRLVDAGTYGSLGEALFNLDLNSGAYSCARCHTKGWSYGEPQTTGGGALGPNLTGGSTIRQFPNQTDMIEFLKVGSELGKRYGEQGQGSGRMPAFGQTYTDEQLKLIVEYVRSL